MKDIENRLIVELMKNRRRRRRSDRELAKVLDVSQPTVSRTRMKLEKEGIFEYSLIPNFAKLRFEILAFTFSDYVKTIQDYNSSRR